MIRFTAADVDAANDAWGANCGPASLAAICDLTLEEARSCMLGFEQKRYTNPTLMRFALDRLSVSWRELRLVPFHPLWPKHGIARIQWHGPWTQPGANPRWAYTHTHWVGVGPLYRTDWTPIPGETCIWDVNTLDIGNGWAPLKAWERMTVPRLTSGIPRATGGWHITHAIEVEPR